MSADAKAKVRAALENLLREIEEKRTTGEAVLRFGACEGGLRLPIRTSIESVRVIAQ